MQVTRRLLMVGGAGIGAAACVTARETSQAPTPEIERARVVAQDMLQANAIPALSLAVARGREVVWAEAYGQADLELGVAATRSHRFRLGSVSKVVTATLAAILASRGNLGLDEPIVSYMPDLPERHRATTLRQLLTHRGGVRHYVDADWDRAALGGRIDDRRYSSSRDILAVFINDPLIAAPGTRVAYSTFGYTLASIVMEHAASKPFIDLVRDEIAVPLELYSLGPDAPWTIVPQRVRGYSPSAHVASLYPAPEGAWANAPNTNPAYKWAGGGIIATPFDLALFGAAHLAPGALTRAALDLLFTVEVEASEASPQLGLGWRINNDDAGRLRWHHAGGQDGARASLVVYPQQRLSIAFMTNVTGAPGDVLALSARLADAFAI